MVSDGLDRVAKGHIGKTGAAFKSDVTDFCYGIANAHTSQSRAILKRIVADGSD